MIYKFLSKFTSDIIPVQKPFNNMYKYSMKCTNVNVVAIHLYTITY